MRNAFFPLMPTASAPGKFILFGEHAVVYGKPAIAMAVNMRTEVTAAFSSRTTVDGMLLKEVRSYYIREMLSRWEGEPVSISIHSGVPPSSGLGSSAALSVAFIAALYSLNGDRDIRRIAEEAFDVEYTVQGGASPTDTSTSALGGAVMVGGEQENPLWEFSKGERSWKIGRIESPELSFVVGVSRVHSPTKIMVQRVRRLVERSPFGMEIIDSIGELVTDAISALKKGDAEDMGELMNRNHELLRTLNVSCPEIERMRDSVMEMSYGVKITGAGGGGSIVALTDRPKDVKKAMESAGARSAYIVNAEKNGILWD